MDLHGLVVEVVAEEVGAADDELLGALADGGVVDRIDPEGAGQVLGEAGVRRVGHDRLKGDGLAGWLRAGLVLCLGLRSGLVAGHNRFLLAAVGSRGPRACVRPLGCGFLGPGIGGRGNP